MKSMFSLSFSVAKRNKGFTLGLVILYMVLTSIICMERYTTSSVRGTIEDYTEAYRVPDIWAVTEPLPESAAGALPEYPEIVGREYGFVGDVRCRVRGKQVFVLNMTGMEEDGFREYYLDDEKHAENGLPEVMISAYFAKAYDIAGGDVVELYTPAGYREFFVSALVSCPENMFCARNSTSWCDSSDFGYLYLERSVMDGYFPTAGCVNLWSFRMSEDCTDAREEEILRGISDSFGEKLVSAERFSTSQVKTKLEDELSQAEKAIRVMPYLAYVMGVFFTCLFIQQVMQGQKKTIGLLRALGYTCSRVLKVFMLYTAMAGIAGTLLGLGLGAILVRFTVGIYKGTYSLPFVHYSTYIPGLILLLMIPLVIGLASCIFRAGLITKMNPAEAYGGAAPSKNSDLPKWLQDLEIPEMNKIAVVSVFRNTRRFILSAVSIAMSIVISLASIALSVSNNAAQPAAFGDENGNGGRFRYDCLIGFSGAEDFEHRVRDTQGVSAAEPVIVWEQTLRYGSNTLDVQINALCESSTLIVPEDKKGVPLQPGNGIILEETAAKMLGAEAGDEILVDGIPLPVTGIAREIVNSIQYVSFETAARLGHGVPGQLAVRFDADADPYDTGAALSELPGFGYAVVREHQMVSVKNGCRAKDAAVYIAAGLAFALGILIIYNMVVLSVREKLMDYATLIALGTPVKGFLSMAFTENVLRYLAAVIPGIPAGYLLASFALVGMGSLKTCYPFIHVGMVCAITALLSLVYLLGGVLFTLWKVKSVEPAAALNARE